MAGLKIENLTKSFGDGRRVIDNLSFDVSEGEFCILLGPSGCGKSTVLKLIAGLERQDEGRIYIGDREVSGLTPKERDIAMVFQSYALYPHLNVYENIAFPLKIRKMPRQEIEEKVHAAARLLDIDSMLKRKPRELSGGQRQRVAIGRAIVREPRLFLFDEPLSNLDAKLRSSMRVELAGLHKKLGITTIYVTHDQIEAMTLGQKIVVIEGGVIQQIGTPREIYDKPANLFTASFIGMPSINLAAGRFIKKGEEILFRSGDLELSLSPQQWERYAGKDVTAGIRPESLRPGEGPVRGSLEHIEHIGSETLLYVKSGDMRITAKAPADYEGRAGEDISLAVNAADIHFFLDGKRLAAGR
ncbi:MAG: sn-glycerol-3-phosphate ABC transporter ATP-binding protein UgpC [Candidatus Sulfobium sp.]|jgi:ABC-type sugar transport system ATPase subunit